VVIGSGQDEAKLKLLAGPQTTFLGWQPDPVLRDHLRRCRALLFPGEEDFGIVPVEAQACGTPVIALGRGGATETIIPLGDSAAPTGVWFAEQSAECLMDALERFERSRDMFEPWALRHNALRFRAERFAAEIFAFVQGVLERKAQNPPLAA
jgi:glycosyltransferase involved in cell wall biosynthesis